MRGGDASADERERFGAGRAHLGDAVGRRRRRRDDDVAETTLRPPRRESSACDGDCRAPANARRGGVRGEHRHAPRVRVRQLVRGVIDAVDGETHGNRAGRVRGRETFDARVADESSGDGRQDAHATRHVARRTRVVHAHADRLAADFRTFDAVQGDERGLGDVLERGVVGGEYVAAADAHLRRRESFAGGARFALHQRRRHELGARGRVGAERAQRIAVVKHVSTGEVHDGAARDGTDGGRERAHLGVDVKAEADGVTAAEIDVETHHAREMHGVTHRSTTCPTHLDAVTNRLPGETSASVPAASE